MFPNSRPAALGYATDDRAVFNFFNAVYAWMCVGLAVTATTAWIVAEYFPAAQLAMSRGWIFLFLIASVLMVMGIRRAALRISTPVALALFVVYSAFVGFVLSFIFLVYRLDSIAGVFVITAGTFGGMSLYGYFTKRDLTSLGSFLVMGLWGLLIATAVNIFWANSGLYWATTYIGLAIFVLLTAYDTQKLKQIAYQVQGDPALASRLAVIGSLELYLDFINMFIYLLRILGKRRVNPETSKPRFIACPKGRESLRLHHSRDCAVACVNVL